MTRRKLFAALLAVPAALMAKAKPEPEMLKVIPPINELILRLPYPITDMRVYQGELFVISGGDIYRIVNTGADYWQAEKQIIDRSHSDPLSFRNIRYFDHPPMQWPR